MSNTLSWPHIAAHSLTIGGKHTFTDWWLVPVSIPDFAPAKPRLDYIDVPGASGSLDISEVLGGISYADLEGSFRFYMIPQHDGTWTTAKSTILQDMQGKYVNCVLDDNPLYFYRGRFWVSEAEPDETGGGYITISYRVDPFQYSIASTENYDWLWNDLFDVTIYYGTFDVDGTKTRTFINPSGQSVEPTFTCSAAMTVTMNGTTYQLAAGENDEVGLVLPAGESTLVFTGTGRVIADYSLGVRL